MLVSRNSKMSYEDNAANRILKKHFVSEKHLKFLNELKDVKFAFILDDSSSMRDRLKNGEKKWDSLKSMIKTVTEICLSRGFACDIFFLNRVGMQNITSTVQLEHFFAMTPTGQTPLTEAFENAVNLNRYEMKKKNLRIILFTDGFPTSKNLSKKDAIKEFKNCLINRDPIDKIFVTICACTDDQHALEFLNNWDEEIKHLDVVDRFLKESREVVAISGKDVTFTYGDYLAKIVIGPLSEEIDKMDEKKKTKKKCIIS